MKKAFIASLVFASTITTLSPTYAVWEGEGSSACPADVVCMTSSHSSYTTKEIHMVVYPHTVNKDSEDSTQVLLVKMKPGAPWKKLSGTIDGFTYEPGHAYDLSVIRETLTDGKGVARFVYTLKKVNKDVNISPSLKKTEWKLQSINGERLEIPSHLTFSDTEMSVKICNSIRSNFSTKQDKISFENGISTLMMCNSPTMPLETALKQTDTVYDVIGDTLNIRTSYGLTAVFTRVK